MAKVAKPTTELEARKKSKLLAGELAERIDTLGQEDELAAAKWVMEEGKEVKQDDEEFETRHLDNLETKKSYLFKNYKEYLTSVITEIMSSRLDLPKQWQFSAWNNSKGVGLSLMAPDKRIFARAFTPMNVPKYDLHACGILCVQADNVIANYLESPSPEKILTKP
jgi:ribosome-associated protein YbcJ (S4-like RNA binding protein)